MNKIFSSQMTFENDSRFGGVKNHFYLFQPTLEVYSADNQIELTNVFLLFREFLRLTTKYLTLNATPEKEVIWGKVKKLCRIRNRFGSSHHPIYMRMPFIL